MKIPVMDSSVEAESSHTHKKILYFVTSNWNGISGLKDSQEQSM